MLQISTIGNDAISAAIPSVRLPGESSGLFLSCLSVSIPVDSLEGLFVTIERRANHGKVGLPEAHQTPQGNPEHLPENVVSTPQTHAQPRRKRMPDVDGIGSRSLDSGSGGLSITTFRCVPSLCDFELLLESAFAAGICLCRCCSQKAH